MSSSNLLLVAITSVFIACNQLGVDPEVLPYLVAIGVLSVLLAVVAMRKPAAAAAPEIHAAAPRGVVRQISNPRARRF